MRVLFETKLPGASCLLFAGEGELIARDESGTETGEAVAAVEQQIYELFQGKHEFAAQ